MKKASAMHTTDFKIIFDKLFEANDAADTRAAWEIVADATPEELDDIAELRRISNELSHLDGTSYTTT